MDATELLRIANSVPALAVERELCKRSLHYFVQRCWHVLEPGKAFHDNWHIQLLCTHLEAVSRGEIHRLLINVPPRHMKSLLVSVIWPVWDWLNTPTRQFLTASYVQKLSTRDALKSRQLLQSAWFQSRFGELVQLGRDQNEKQRYQNTAMGHRIAISVSGGVGEGGDILIADDPQNTDEMTSDAYIEATHDWWKNTFNTRLNSSDGAIVLTMQRLSTQDLAAVALDEGGWTHLMLPAEFEPARACTTPWGSDPRTTEGELIWPGHFNAEHLARLKRNLGSAMAAGQLQQRPAPKGGSILKRDWYRTIKRSVLPSFFAYFVSIDTAATDNVANDPTGCTVWGLSREKGREGMFMLAQHEEWLDVPALLERIPEFGRDYPGAVYLIESAGPSGLAAIQILRAKKQLPVVPINPKELGGGKEQRATLAAAYIEQGLIWLVEEDPKREKFLDMSDAFPKCKPRDVVDSAIQAILHVCTSYTFHSSDEESALDEYVSSRTYDDPDDALVHDEDEGWR